MVLRWMIGVVGKSAKFDGFRFRLVAGGGGAWIGIDPKREQRYRDIGDDYSDKELSEP